ncbi:MAG TPA: hypothetical protein VF824_21265 [Thermoanaerobaculia bacterium]|jgi:hypothetical protein
MKNSYRMALALSIVTTLMLIWLSVGVGIIGKDGDRANLMYFGVVAVGLIGALVSRLRPAGMSRTLTAMAAAQTIVALVAIFGGLGRPYSGALELSLLNGFFVAMFLAASWLFRSRSLATA